MSVFWVYQRNHTNNNLAGLVKKQAKQKSNFSIYILDFQLRMKPY